MSTQNNKREIRVDLGARAETMTVEAAARALGFLARWAGRRLQRRLEARRNAPDEAVTGEETKGYEGEIEKN